MDIVEQRSEITRQIFKNPEKTTFSLDPRKNLATHEQYVKRLVNVLQPLAPHEREQQVRDLFNPDFPLFHADDASEELIPQDVLFELGDERIEAMLPTGLYEMMNPEKRRAAIKSVVGTQELHQIENPETGETATVLSPLLINPTIVRGVAELLNDVPHLFHLDMPARLDESITVIYAALGSVLGAFDGEDRGVLVRRFHLTPHITDDMPEFVQRLKVKEADLGLDTSRLQQLKGFWNGVFASFLEATKSAEHFIPESKQQSLVAVERRRPAIDDSIPYWYGLRRGEVETEQQQVMADQWASQRKLDQALVRLVKSYQGNGTRSDDEVISRVRGLFDHRTSLAVLKTLVHETNSVKSLEKDQLTVLAEKLMRRVGKERWQRLMGREIDQISPIETVALLGYCSFATNGKNYREVRASTDRIHRLILPLLEGHHDQVEVPPWEVDVEHWTETRAAIERRREELWSQGLGWTDQPVVLDILEENDAYAEELLKRVGLSLEKVRTNMKREVNTNVAYLAAYMAGGVGSVVTARSYFPDGMTGELLQGLLPVLFSLGMYKLRVAVDIRDSGITRKVGAIRNFSMQFRDELEKQLEGYKGKRIKARQEAAKIAVVTFLLSSALIYRPWEKWKELDRVGEGIGEALVDAKPGFLGSENADSRRNENLVNIENLAEAPELGSSHYVVIENPNNFRPRFWGDQPCWVSLIGSEIECLNLKDDEGEEIPVLALNQEQMHDLVDSVVKSDDMMLRFNLDPEDGRFGIPEGWEPFSVIVPEGTAATGRYDPLAGITVMANYRAGVLYRPLENSSEIIPSGFDRLGETWETRQLFERKAIEGQDLYQVRVMVQQAREKFQSGASKREVLSLIQDEIANLGITYGFERMKSDDLFRQSDVMARLFEQKDGELVHDKWICNQFAYATYTIARAAGLTDVIIGRGNFQDAPGWGGYESRNHMIIYFREEGSKRWELFEATLPAGDIEYPVVPNQPMPGLDELFGQEDAQNQETIVKGLVAGMMALAGAYGANRLRLSKKEQREWRRLAREQVETMQLELDRKLGEAGETLVEKAVWGWWQLTELVESDEAARQLGKDLAKLVGKETVYENITKAEPNSGDEAKSWESVGNFFPSPERLHEFITETNRGDKLRRLGVVREELMLAAEQIRDQVSSRGLRDEIGLDRAGGNDQTANKLVDLMLVAELLGLIESGAKALERK